MRRKGSQSSLASSLERLIGKLDRSSGGYYLQTRVMAAWDKVAGPAVAAHTTGAHLRNGELVVQVDSNLWATELSALAGHYAESMNSELGKRLVRSVRFTVTREAHQRRIALQEELDDQRPSKEPAPIIRSLSAAEKAQVEASVASISDKDLREAVLRATIAHLERIKGS